MSRWNHLMCAACWNAAANHGNDAEEGMNPQAENCCFCGKPTTSGIWIRGDPDDMDCHHCQHPECDELGPIGINETWCCIQHVDWAMTKAFKPLKDAMG